MGTAKIITAQSFSVRENALGREIRYWIDVADDERSGPDATEWEAMVLSVYSHRLRIKLRGMGSPGKEVKYGLIPKNKWETTNAAAAAAGELKRRKEKFG